MDSNKTWMLMARRLAGEATPAEMLELDRLLLDHPQYQIALELTQTYWNQHPDTPLTEREIEVALDRIMHAEDAGMQQDSVLFQWEVARRRSRRRRGMVLGAVGVLGIGIALCLLLILPRTEPGRGTGVTARLTQVQTRMGTRTNLLLPDGTTVWLNAGSTLTYPPSFTGPNREVILEGEAFFDVAKNPAHPFIVHASSVNIRVLGTSFDVKAYARDKTMETILIRGSIEVTLRNRPQSRIILKPNEKLVVAKDDSVFNAARAEVTRQADTKPARQEAWADIRKPTLDLHSGAIIETSWMENKLIFQDEAFQDLAIQMERWYGVSVTFDRPKLKGLRFTGTFQKETIQQALGALQLTAEFDYIINGNQITIYER